MSFSYHTAKLPNGIEIFYSDTGSVHGSDSYTTLIVLHGSSFNGIGFERLHAHAHQLNLRVVLWNRRDYGGSTKYSDAELEDLKNGRQVFLERLALQDAQFLKYFIEKNNIPRVTADRKGGVALMGWSMGTATVMSMFAYPEAIPEELYKFVLPYVKDMVLCDPPYLSFGYELPADHKSYNPWTDSDYPSPEALYANFEVWVSGYYDHPSITSGHVNDLSFEKRTKRATINDMPPELRERAIDPTASVRSDMAMYVPPMQGTINQMITKALYDGKLVENFFPTVRVTHITGIQTNWHCIWGWIENKRIYDKHLKDGKKIRSCTFIKVEGGNHFMHYDAPRELLEATLKGVVA